MKKNVMMRVASIMLVLVLMTSSVISGTYAKYVTQDSGADEARVAKWGVELQVIGNLYGTSYDNNIVVSADDADDKIEVQAVDYKLATASDVVAPGTQNTEGFTFSLKGKPEVDGQVDVTIITQNIFLNAGTYGVMIPVDAGVVTAGNFAEFADDLYTKSGSSYTKATAWADATTYYTLEDEVELTKNYYPVEYSIKRGAAPLGGGGIDADSFEAVIAKLAKFTFTGTDKGEATTEYVAAPVKFQTNQQLEEVCLLNDLVITWEWKFEQPVNAAMYNGADTILGNLMTAKLNSGKVVEGEVVKLDSSNYVLLTEYTDYCLETQFSIDIAATQVD